MAAVLSADLDNTDKIVVLIEECRTMKLAVFPPDVNESMFRFTVSGSKAIRYGLGAVKGVGASAIGDILDERARNGPFRDLTDLCRRVDLKKVNRRVLDALIRGGAVDSIDENRAAQLAALPDAIRTAEQAVDMEASGQVDLFGLDTPQAAAVRQLSVPVVEPWSERERLAQEKATLGLYLTGHPIGEYEREIAAMITARLGDIAADSGRTAAKPETRAVVAGLIVDQRVRQGKNGKRMAFVTLDDRTGRLEVAVYPDVYDQFRESLTKDTLAVVEGTLGFDEFSGQNRLTAERIDSIESARARLARQLVITWPECESAAQMSMGATPLEELRNVLKAFQGGTCPIVIDYCGSGASTRLQLGDGWRVNPGDDLLHRLRRTLGETAVHVVYQ
jgi:DNA polymerase-3 subunit alpha